MKTQNLLIGGIGLAAVGYILLRRPEQQASPQFVPATTGGEQLGVTFQQTSQGLLEGIGQMLTAAVAAVTGGGSKETVPATGGAGPVSGGDVITTMPIELLQGPGQGLTYGAGGTGAGETLSGSPGGPHPNTGGAGSSPATPTQQQTAQAVPQVMAMFSAEDTQRLLDQATRSGDPLAMDFYQNAVRNGGFNQVAHATIAMNGVPARSVEQNAAAINTASAATGVDPRWAYLIG